MSAHALPKKTRVFSSTLQTRQPHLPPALPALQVLPTTEVQFTFAGAASKEADGRYRFEAPPAAWKPWQPVLAAVGDLPVFAQLFGDGRTPFSGPAALLGLDVLSQRRVVIGAGVGAKGRARPLLVSPA
jgi:hypothetical protein